MNKERAVLEQFITDEEYSQMMSDAFNAYGEQGFEDYFFSTGKFALYLTMIGKVVHNGQHMIKVSTGKEIKLWNKEQRSFN